MPEDNARADGRATREKLISCAGKLIAKQGYAATTSKEICEMAGTNLAAVNYHFGSRDGLYREVLKTIHNYLVNLEELQKLQQSTLPARDKLSCFLDYFVQQILDGAAWQAQVWARELLQPSSVIYDVIRDNALPKGMAVLKMFEEYTGLPSSDPRLYSALLSFMAPFIILFYTRHNQIEYSRFLPVPYPPADLLPNLKKFAFAGLDAFRQH